MKGKPLSSLVKLRARNRPSTGLTAQTVGNAIVVHGPEGMSAETRLLASALPADPDNDLVVAAPPPDAAGGFWESFAATLPRARRGLRLVLANRSRELGALAGHWLSTRLDRTVLAPDGIQIRDLNGSLFVHGGPGSGWIRFRPGHEPEREAKRFPRPCWESAVVADPFRVGPASTAEPVPAGLWLRPDGDQSRLDAGRNRLIHGIPCQPDILTIVLGGRDLPELPLQDVVPLWQALLADDLPKVRFVHLGPVTLPTHKSFGQALADLLRQEITCYTGIPVGRADAPDVHLLRQDGSHGWHAFVQQLIFRPGDTAPPRLRTHRAPLPGLPEIGPAIYRYAADVVVEVVLAGLWIRPPDAPAHADTVRALPVDPATNLVLYEESDHRMWTAAQEVLEKLDYSTRLASKPLPTSVVVPVLAPVAVAPEPVAAVPEPVAVAPEPVAAVSEPVAAAASPGDPARAWIRTGWPDEFGERADQIRAVLADHPKLVTGSPEDAVVDAVALRMYLTGHVPRLDEGLRTGMDGPHVQFGRCAAAALTSLPSHRGGTIATHTPTPEQWEFYRQHTLVSEGGFHTMLAAPSPGAEGTADLLVWSMTGRRTALLEDPEATVDGRVVFPPGTIFKVLEVTEADGDKRGRILLRELSSTEIADDGTVDENRQSLDELATTSLLRFLDKPATRKPERVPATLAPGLFRLPGVTDT